MSYPNDLIISVFFTLLRAALRGRPLSPEEKTVYDARMLPVLLALGKKHDLAHLLVYALKMNGLCPAKQETLERPLFTAVYRYEQMNCARTQVYQALEKAAIPFMPLKGSVLCDAYPQPWMRTSCDIDLLVHREDLVRATEILQQECGYTYDREGPYDRSFSGPNYTHIELHYTLVDDTCTASVSDILSTVWASATVAEGLAYRYDMAPDLFYFYHIAHMAKHMTIGGCGIRPLIDLWMLDTVSGLQSQQRDALLQQGGMLQFAAVARSLSQVWLAGEAHTDLTQQLARFIIRGGIYGNTKNRVAVQQQKQGGRLRYALSRIFLPYEVIKFQYPILQKHPWLTPVMEVCRWFCLLFGGRAKHAVREFDQNRRLSDADTAAMRVFLENIGL